MALAPWKNHQAFFDGFGSQVQSGQNDLQKMLCLSAPKGRQL
jgi:hypothetical protein